MGQQRLIHDAAWTTALAILDCIRTCLREEEHRDALEEFYGIIKAGLTQYEERVDRQRQRVHPLESEDRVG